MTVAIEAKAADDPFERRVVAAQLRAHYAQIPAMAIAPTAGGFFTAWVLWGAVENSYLVIGVSAVTLLSAARLLLFKRFFAADERQADRALWRRVAVGAAFFSGCLWGSAAPLLYPPNRPDYAVYLLVLLTLLPIVPVAALAVYMPAFYAYFIPCMAPFIITLALQDPWPDKMTALLLVMMMMAMLTFALSYSRSLAEAIRLRLRLAEKSAALEEAIKHKSQFIAAASHDLRQPVHAMGLFIESLRDGDAGSTSHRVVNYLDASLRNLRSMLNNMLDISTLEAATVKVQLQDVALDAMLQKLADEFTPLAAQRGLRFRYRRGRWVVRSDPALLERMLRNLLSNALKYTPRGGVLLACRRHDQTLLLQVWDTGRGIRADQFELVFREFTRIDDQQRDQIDGLGLGLAIVQRMGLLLGHPVSLRSRVGQGSVFSLELGHGHAPDAPPDTGNTTEPAAPGAGLVMVVDDDESVGAGTATLIERWGYRTRVCKSAAEAVATLAAGGESPQLLIVDFRLGPGMSGREAVESIQQRLGHAVPVIIVTGDTEPMRIREAVEAGHALLHKPVDPKRLRACIAVALPNPGDTGTAPLGQA